MTSFQFLTGKLNRNGIRSPYWKANPDGTGRCRTSRSVDSEGGLATEAAFGMPFSRLRTLVVAMGSFDDCKVVKSGSTVFKKGLRS